MAVYNWTFVWDALPLDVKRCNHFGDNDSWYESSEDVFVTDGKDIRRERGFYITGKGDVLTSLMPGIIAWIPANLFIEEVIPRYVCPPLPTISAAMRQEGE